MLPSNRSSATFRISLDVGHGDSIFEMRSRRRQDWIDYLVQAEIERYARLERMQQIILYLDTLAKLGKKPLRSNASPITSMYAGSRANQ
jgi:hypothetical protein